MEEASSAVTVLQVGGRHADTEDNHQQHAAFLMVAIAEKVSQKKGRFAGGEKHSMDVWVMQLLTWAIPVVMLRMHPHQVHWYID